MTNKFRIAAKRALLRQLDKELDLLVGRFLTETEQLRARSISEEQERLENEIIALGGEP